MTGTEPRFDTTAAGPYGLLIPLKRGESKKRCTSSHARLKSASSSAGDGGVRRSGGGEGKDDVAAMFWTCPRDEGDADLGEVLMVRAAFAVNGRAAAVVLAVNGLWTATFRSVETA